MNAEIIQAQYDQLDQIAARFGQSAEASAALRWSILNSSQALEKGGWEGQGAAAFRSRMHGEVLPALQRLTQACQKAQQITIEVKNIMLSAEDKAAEPFKIRGKILNILALRPELKRELLMNASTDRFAIDISSTDTDLDGPYSGGNFNFSYRGGSSATVTFQAYIDFSRGNYTLAEQEAFKERLHQAVQAWNRAAIFELTDKATGDKKLVELEFQLVTVSHEVDAHKKVDVHPPDTYTSALTTLLRQKDTAIVMKDANVYIDSSRNLLAHELGHAWGLEDEYDVGYIGNLLSPAQARSFGQALFGRSASVESDTDALMNDGTEFRERYFKHFLERIREGYEDKGMDVEGKIILNKTQI